MFEYHKQLDSTQWFRGFVQEVLDSAPTPGGLRALAVHPRESSPGEQGETAVVFFAPGVRAVAVAAWKWKRWTIDNRPWHGLFRILDEPATHFIVDSSILSLRASLLELNEILTARAAGDPIADILLSSSASGAALELAHLAKTKLRFVGLPACRSLETYLAEFPSNLSAPVGARPGDLNARMAPAIALLPPNQERSSTFLRVGQKVLRSVSVASHRRMRASRLACEELQFELPDELLSLSAADRSIRCKMSHDLCTLDGQRIFLLGVLPLPVHGAHSPYCLRLWAEVEPSALRQAQDWYAEAPARRPPLPGELANRVPLVPTTTGLPIDIHLEDTGDRPKFILRESEHPLSAEQQMGIGSRRAAQYASVRGARRDWAGA